MKIAGDAIRRLPFRGRSTRAGPASTCSSPAAFAKTSSSGGRRWTAGRFYHTRGPQERHLCQLDYILLSPALAAQNADGRARHHPQRPAVAHRSSRPARRWSAFRAPAGTGRRRRTIARWPITLDMAESGDMSFRSAAQCHPAGRRDRRSAGSRPASVRARQRRGDRRELAARDGGQSGAVRRHGGAAVAARLSRQPPGRPLPCGQLLDLHATGAGGARVRRRRARLSRMPCWSPATMRWWPSAWAPTPSIAGRVYFAAGSFEPVDFRDGLVDVDFNMIREVREETGLDLSGASAASATTRCRRRAAR